jgi:hypothetical protein
MWEEEAAAILSYYVDVLLATQKKSKKIPICYNDVSDHVEYTFNERNSGS